MTATFKEKAIDALHKLVVAEARVKKNRTETRRRRVLMVMGREMTRLRIRPGWIK